MKRNRTSKLSASLIVLVMAMSALVLLPPESGGEPASTSNIYVPVLSGGFPVTDAWVNLTNVHTGAVTAAQYTPSKSAYAVNGAPSAYYRVDVVHSNYYDQLDAAEFRFDGFSNYTTALIQLTAFDYKGYTWNVTVRNPLNQPMGSGVVVGFYDPVNKEFVSRGVTNSASYVVLSMFGTTVVGDVYLVAIKPGFQTYIEPVLVNADNTTTINFANSVLISSYITDSSGPATNVISYLINTDSSVPWIKRVLKSTGSAMAFDAYNGNFVLVVDADGDASDVRLVTVSGTPISLTINLGQQTKRTEQVAITYGSDFNSFSAAVNTVWSYDQAHPGLMMSDLGSLRMQVDLTLGNGDGTLQPGEVTAFYNKVNSFGTQFTSSSNLLTLNSTVYESALAITGYTNDLAGGSVVSTTGVHYAYTCQYTSHAAIDVGADDYTASAWSRYDTAQVDYQTSISLVNEYELVANSSTSLVAVSGYETIGINPKVGTAGSGELVSLTLEASVRPVAKAAVLGSTYAHTVLDSEGNVSRYLVAINQNVTLTTSGSDDPNKNPLRYMWNYGDGNFGNTSDATIVHMFTVAGSYTVNLTVKDVTDRENWSEISVICDDEDPSPVITVKDKTIASNTIEVNMREVVYFNATSSTDSAVTAGDNLGMIDHVVFNWGDDPNVTARIEWSADQQNVTKSWQKSGTYTITLNATDVVGHYALTTMTVKVNDTEAPTVQFVVLNETWNASYNENKTLYFDAANATLDNVDELVNMTFSWDFADGSYWNATGAWNVTHIFNSTGAFNIALNVTDQSGNYNIGRKLITILPGPRPDLWIERVYYDPLNFTEGKSGFILVNITNKGSLPANLSDLQISFYIVTADGKQKAISGTGLLYNETGAQITVIEAGQKAQYRLEYTPGSKGTFTIRVNVTCSEQLRPFSYTARDDDAMHVSQAAWKQWALWGGVLAIIVLIPLLLMLRGRLAKREKKGPRRERKEKEKTSDEDL